MKLRSSVSTAGTFLFVAAVMAMLVGQQLGQPILLGFVVTGSMSPTLEAGDGFVAIPPALAGDVEQGDVITFDARELEGGGLTTHRVVEETDEGYITRGDANPFTDQDGPEPPVQESQIAAVAWRFGGDLVVVPHLGTVALALQGVAAALIGILIGVPGVDAVADGNVGRLMIGAGVLLLLFSFVSDLVRGERRTGGERSRARGGSMRASTVLAVILLLILVPATASMVVPSGMNEVTIVSSQSPSSAPTVIERGGNQTLEYNVTNNGYIPLVAIIEPASTGVDVGETTHVVRRGESAGTTATLSAPEETGVYYRAIAERQYIGILPLSVIVALHKIHPWVAIAVIDAVIAATVTVIFALAIGFEPLRFRDANRDITLSGTVRRKIRRWL
ncbi:MAG: signal peptidase I [Natronomonas sp.]|jgi:signal peptidase|uniref:signal peptidase I n=1 Tax=Natronomonas sp. TaxID=2184060 RepID=UPI00286FB79D|nr:signal peptidase I [Natronomonas sp.]MDR9429586.1 signal peptidase I [Natronomonas sp.]